MPARIAHAPRTVPTQDVFRLGPFPERKILWVALAIARQPPRPGFLLLKATMRQLAVIRPACYVEVDVAVGNVGMSFIDQRLDHLDLFGNVGAGARADIR